MITIKLSHADEVQRLFDELRRSAQVEIKKTITRLSLEMEERAKTHVPVDMGHLRASIRTRFFKNGMAAFVECGASYGPFVEYGTGPLGAQGSPYGGPLPSGYVHNSGSRKMPPYDIILEWVRRKNLRLYDAGSTMSIEAQQRHVAFLISRHIQRYGTKARPFMYRAFREVESTGRKELEEAFSRGLKNVRYRKTY